MSPRSKCLTRKRLVNGLFGLFGFLSIIIFIKHLQLVSMSTTPDRPPLDMTKIPLQQVVGNEPVQKIPKIIWTYWSSEKIPIFVEKCIKSWKRHNPDHSVHVLNRRNLEFILKEKVPAGFDQVTEAAAQADWVRLTILKEQGGIWMDASIIATGSLDFVHQKQQEYKSEGFLFYLDGFTKNYQYPVVEGWFIASIPHSSFVSAWQKEFTYAFVNHGMRHSYLDELSGKYGPEKYNELVQGIDWPIYLLIDISWQKIVQIDGVKQPYMEAAESAPHGPYQTMYQFDWKFDRFALALLKKWEGEVPVLIKLTNGMRKSISLILWLYFGMSKESIYYKYLSDN